VAAIGSGGQSASAACAPLRIMPMGDSITHGFTGPPAESYRGYLAQSLAKMGAAFDMVGFHRNNTIGPHPEDFGLQWGTNWQGYSGPLDLDFEGKNGYQAGRPVGYPGPRGPVAPGPMIVQLLDNDIPLYAPDVVLLNLGTNDSYGGNVGYSWGTEGAAANVLALIDKVHALRPQTQVLVTGITKAGVTSPALGNFDSFLTAGVSARVAQGRKLTFVDAYAGLTAGDMQGDRVHLAASGSVKMAANWLAAVTPYLCGGSGGSSSTSSTTTTVPPTGTGRYLEFNATTAWSNALIGSAPGSVWSPARRPADGRTTLEVTMRRPTGSDITKLQIRPQSANGVAVGAFLPPGNTSTTWFVVKIPLSSFPAGAFNDITELNVFNSSPNPMRFDISRIAFAGGTAAAFAWYDGNAVAIDKGQMTVIAR
jgi:GDSL-like Lipase/Acylhydrolase family